MENVHRIYVAKVKLDQLQAFCEYCVNVFEFRKMLVIHWIDEQLVVCHKMNPQPSMCGTFLNKCVHLLHCYSHSGDISTTLPAGMWHMHLIVTISKVHPYRM
jgi:hypothetical protein